MNWRRCAAVDEALQCPLKIRNRTGESSRADKIVNVPIGHFASFFQQQLDRASFHEMAAGPCASMMTTPLLPSKAQFLRLLLIIRVGRHTSQSTSEWSEAQGCNSKSRKESETPGGLFSAVDGTLGGLVGLPRSPAKPAHLSSTRGLGCCDETGIRCGGSTRMPSRI